MTQLAVPLRTTLDGMREKQPGENLSRPSDYWLFVPGVFFSRIPATKAATAASSHSIR
jgi:hypothetical protein